jgi:polyhydroxybutyrate depolymerase
MRQYLAIFALLAAACGSGDPEAPTQFQFGGDRPVFLEVPSSYDHGEPTPLLVVLHGFGANAFTQLAYTGLDDLVEDQGILMVAPDGTVNPDGKQFWNATDACCDGYGSGVDDVGYITGLIDEISAVWNVDPDRVYLFGHSNGGYMSYRLACDSADRIAAIVSLAGATWNDEAACAPTSPVSVLQIHGTADDTVPYDGGGLTPSAARTAELWAGYDGCTGNRTARAGRLDLDLAVEGDDTAVEATDGCAGPVGVELWTIEGGGHLPNVTDAFPGAVWEFFEAHPKS